MKKDTNCCFVLSFFPTSSKGHGRLEVGSLSSLVLVEFCITGMKIKNSLGKTELIEEIGLQK